MDILRFNPVPNGANANNKQAPFMLKFMEEAISSPVSLSSEFSDDQCYLGVTSDSIGDYASD